MQKTLTETPKQAFDRLEHFLKDSPWVNNENAHEFNRVSKLFYEGDADFRFVYFAKFDETLAVQWGIKIGANGITDHYLVELDNNTPIKHPVVPIWAHAVEVNPDNMEIVATYRKIKKGAVVVEEKCNVDGDVLQKNALASYVHLPQEYKDLINVNGMEKLSVGGYSLKLDTHKTLFMYYGA